MEASMRHHLFAWLSAASVMLASGPAAAVLSPSSPETKALPTSSHAGSPPTAPPPSAYDLQRRSLGSAPDDGTSLTGQLVRTVLSLLLVVAIIYAAGKLALWKLGKGRIRSGLGLRVVERLQLDTKHSLYIIEVQGKQRFLLGTGGDKAVTLLTTLALDGPGATEFAHVLSSHHDGNTPTANGDSDKE